MLLVIEMETSTNYPAVEKALQLMRRRLFDSQQRNITAATTATVVTTTLEHDSLDITTKAVGDVCAGVHRDFPSIHHGSDDAAITEAPTATNGYTDTSKQHISDAIPTENDHIVTPSTPVNSGKAADGGVPASFAPVSPWAREHGALQRTNLRKAILSRMDNEIYRQQQRKPQVNVVETISFQPGTASVAVETTQPALSDVAVQVDIASSSLSDDSAAITDAVKNSNTPVTLDADTVPLISIGADSCEALPSVQMRTSTMLPAAGSSSILDDLTPKTVVHTWSWPLDPVKPAKNARDVSFADRVRRSAARKLAQSSLRAELEARMIVRQDEA